MTKLWISEILCYIYFSALFGSLSFEKFRNRLCEYSKFHNFVTYQIIFFWHANHIDIKSRGFLQHQKMMVIYYVKKFVKESQFLLFSRQEVYQNANFLETCLFSLLRFFDELFSVIIDDPFFDIVKILRLSVQPYFSGPILWILWTLILDHISTRILWHVLWINASQYFHWPCSV